MKKITAILIVVTSALLIGCGILRPHQVDVQQGNTLSQVEIQQLHLNLKKSEVQDLLGKPLLTNAFDNDYWTYVYTNQINGGKIAKQDLNLRFSNNRLIKIERQ